MAKNSKKEEEKISSKTRKIGDQYYTVGDINVLDSGECYYLPEVDDYIIISRGQLVYDYSRNRYVIKGITRLHKGIIGFDEHDSPLLGYFSILEGVDYKNKLYLNGSTYTLLNLDIISQIKVYKLGISNNIYYDIRNTPAIKFYQITNCDQQYKKSLNYDSHNIMDEYIKAYNKLYKPTIDKNVKTYGKALKDLTFGLEFETTRGMIPESITKPLGLIPLRDGSVNGIEYVTIPLQGDKGLQTVIDSVHELKTNTKFDNSCSLHLHIGNIPRTESFIVALYKMLYILQDDFFDLYPFHKKVNFKIKRKHYTKPLDLKSTMLRMDPIINSDNVSDNFKHIYEFLSMGYNYENVGCDLKNVKSHPSDPDGNRKWNIRTRYYWVNLIPLLFGNKKTVEFRIHTPTTDINKVMNYIYMCCGVINFVKDNEENILNNPRSYLTLSLKDVLYHAYSDFNVISKELSRYIDCRAKHFYNKTAKGDFIANENDFKLSSYYINWNSNLKKGFHVANLRSLYTPTELSSFKNLVKFNDDYNEDRIVQRENLTFRADPITESLDSAVRSNMFSINNSWSRTR